MKRFSIVKTEVKKRLLLKGMLLSILGIFLLIGMGTFAKVTVLSVWGLPSFCVGIFLIGWGLIPYRNLTRLETHPHQILFEKDHLTFISTHGNHVLVPYRNIGEISYVEAGNRYGIRLSLKEGDPLFLPYFLNDSSLHEIVHPNESDKPI
ncbi:MAG: hypothetical protein KFB93_00065 [Simkaniaceae bacterium]|nr:MAG: hypothetical protein KFB93_00065 [Simkaniaceae bacterium]